MKTGDGIERVIGHVSRQVQFETISVHPEQELRQATKRQKEAGI
jgi:hypothetical protein